MFYFFSRGTSFLRCEIRPHDGHGRYEVVIAEPGLDERVDVFDSSIEAHQHWINLQQELNQQGWWGPHGRD